MPVIFVFFELLTQLYHIIEKKSTFFQKLTIYCEAYAFFPILIYVGKKYPRLL